MSEEWNEARLQQFIDAGIEEGPNLEYKGAGALGTQNNKKDEITKDVSAFANAAGGTLIYGIREFEDDARCHLPEGLDPISRAAFPREWLDQIIGQIAPRIADVKINPVELSSASDHTAYVVEVPKGSTAHQARDYRYWRRYNFEAVRMSDYEIRDVSNRKKHPQVVADIFVAPRTLSADDPEPNPMIYIRVRNVSDVIARYVAVVVRLPHKLGQHHWLPDNSHVDRIDGLNCAKFRVRNGINAPLFPGDELVIEREIQQCPPLQYFDGKPEISDIRLTVFADEMQKVEIRKDVAAALKKWVEE